MQVRMFRLISLLIGILCLTVVFPSNLLQNLPPIVNVLLLIFGGFALFCYRESLRGRDHSIALMICVMGMMSPAWFFNGGSQGSVSFYFIAGVLIPVALWRGPTRWILTAFVVMDLLILLVLEYWFPQLTTPFKRPGDRLIDLITGIITAGLLLAVIAWVFIESYDWEQARISRIARELAVSEKNYREVVENAKNIILRLDAEGRITFFNRFAEEVFGYTRQEVVGRHVVGTIVPVISSQGADTSALMNRILKEPRAHSYVENENISRSGKRLCIAWTNQPVNDEQGGHVELLCVGTDITERAELMERLQLTQTTMDAAAEPIVWLKPDGQIIYANNAAGKTLGLTPTEIPELRLHNILRDLTAAAWDERWSELTKAGALNFEATLRALGGVDCPVELSLTHMNIHGNEYATVFLHDLTERRQAEGKRLQQEQQLLQLQKLESLGLLAGGIAHDFNNLLTAIMGNISLAKMNLSDSSERYQSLDEAEKASFQAKDLTAQLLTFSKGGKPLKQLASLDQIIRESARLALRGSPATCLLSLPPDLWLVEADAAQIAQVFNNLLINGQQAMPGGGQISIEARNLELTGMEHLLLAAGKYIEVSVRDQGEGISEDNLPRIFEPYFTTKQAGSGLGLSVVHSILKNHQGAIRVTSRVGEGTTFTLWLPATAQPVPDADPVSETAPQFIATTAHRVLVMDDEEMVRTLVMRILKPFGCEVEGVADGTAAVDSYREAITESRPFDLVIMDLTIPGGMGGQETIQRLRQIDPTVRAIVSSGYSSSPVMADYHAYGFAGVVKKPFTASQLKAALQPLLKS
jgi:two-component system, cell cycle sensor histidine kinase and response regulator CckA